MDFIPSQLKSINNNSLSVEEETFYQTNCVPEFFRQRIQLVSANKDVLQPLFQCCVHMGEGLRRHALLRLQPERSVLSSSLTRSHYITTLQSAPQSTWTTPSQIDSWIAGDVSRILAFKSNPDFVVLAMCDYTDFVIVMEKALGNYLQLKFCDVVTLEMTGYEFEQRFSGMSSSLIKIIPAILVRGKIACRRLEVRLCFCRCCVVLVCGCAVGICCVVLMCCDDVL